MSSIAFWAHRSLFRNRKKSLNIPIQPLGALPMSSRDMAGGLEEKVGDQTSPRMEEDENLIDIEGQQWRMEDSVIKLI